MRQPELGLKVAELRVARQMTQEALADRCQVSTRTIQRIESSEVEPRLHTLGALSATLEHDLGEGAERSESLWIAGLHLSSMFLMLLVPIVIWSWKKPHSPRIDAEARQVLNFQITMSLVLLSWGFLAMLLPLTSVLAGEPASLSLESGPFYVVAMLFTAIPPVAIAVLCFLQGAVNTARSLANGEVRYVPSIPFVK